MISHVEYDAAQLIAQYPPRWHHENKQQVAEASSPPNAVHAGTLRVTRWRAPALPDTLVETARPDYSVRADVFGYEPTPGDAVEWYLNFADRHLFCAYGGRLLAQDELQVIEHPVLASLREALVATEGVAPLTSDAKGPTPVLITDAERRIRLALDPNASEGRPRGLYGNAFARASKEGIQNAVTRLEPPTRTHIIAMHAPSGGVGFYTSGQIEDILTTAVSAFSAAVIETARRQAGARTIVHTGYWGCGAFGGNKILMSTLQLMAAHIARVDRLVFHTVDEAGLVEFREAEGLVDQLVSTFETKPLYTLIAAITARRYRWGVSNGT